MVNHIQRLGLAEHFSEEIDDILSQVYRTYCNKNEEQSCPKQFNLVPAKIFKDSLAFRLLRMHGFNVNPWNFCWFLHHEDILNHIEQNKERYINAMYNVYRATDLMFKGEDELEETRSLSRKVLQKAMSSTKGENPDISLGLQKLIEHELNIEWTARLDHLDHRIWIEENKVRPLWIGNASDCRLSCLHNEKLMQLAVENYEFRQSIYRNELEELKRWSKESGLSEMGFGREKTTYCYFATASSCCHLPHNSPVRTIAAKSAILITVADDYFDMKGSLKELKCLTNAIQRWNGKGLTGHGKIIFDALDDLVRDLAALHLHQQGNNITKNLKAIWRETFASWMVESTWSKTGYIPSMAEYLEFGKTSIGSHTLTLIASCFLNPSLPIHKLKPPVIYETVTILLMSLARLLNDIQSYQKEIEDGKMNFVLLHLRENPETNIEDSIAYTEDILKENKKEFLKHVLLDGLNDLPKSCRQLHLSCLKAFHMFFNSKNLFDSDAELFHEIKKAIYIPFEHQIPKVPVQVVPLPPILVDSTPKKYTSVTTAQFTHAFKFHSSSRRRSIIRHQKLPNIVSVDGRQKVLISKMSNLCLI